MKTIGNILWFLFTGLWTGIGYGVLGVFWCITIIGIPFGMQCFKLARLAFWPFGSAIVGGAQAKAINDAEKAEKAARKAARGK